MSTDGQQPHILVVDDSPEILDLKDDILEGEGFRVSTRLRRDTGLSEVMEQCPHLLVMDYVHQDQSSLMHDVATDPHTRHIPILLCTGAIREVEAIRSELDAMGIRVIFKPFDIDYLIALVRESMGLSV
jgi:two-component system OmpR family response regulator